MKLKRGKSSGGSGVVSKKKKERKEGKKRMERNVAEVESEKESIQAVS